MTFDEVLDEMNADQEPSEAIRFMERLRDIYAPTVEMTKEQYDYISQLLQESNEIGATFTEFWEVYIFTGLSKKIKPAFESQEHAMQAWLHPETIKIVDE
ncbi:hypothetical protein [Leuconostoc mesenteroides]|uniref:hypothetical protein n=1 Tax=Leuconostoc mesenteroides TaxID=1245 RepID=UPI0021A86616|nr:hypothetical protein [Leuconostoc mesenteroides]MCT3053620.1 hypothetical protein [Leuconostoc mesenteroides]